MPLPPVSASEGSLCLLLCCAPMITTRLRAEVKLRAIPLQPSRFLHASPTTSSPVWGQEAQAACLKAFREAKMRSSRFPSQGREATKRRQVLYLYPAVCCSRDFCGLY